MHEFRKIPTANKTYTSSQKYTNMVVGEHRIQTFKVLIVVLFLLLLSFDPTSAQPLLLFMDKCFVQIYLNVNVSPSPNKE